MEKPRPWEILAKSVQSILLEMQGLPVLIFPLEVEKKKRWVKDPWIQKPESSSYTEVGLFFVFVFLFFSFWFLVAWIFWLVFSQIQPWNHLKCSKKIQSWCSSIHSFLKDDLWVKLSPVQTVGYQLFAAQCDLADEWCCYTKEIRNKVKSERVAGWFAS